MDKKSILGLVLIFAIVIAFSYFNRPAEAELAAAQRQRDSLAAVEASRKAEEEAEMLRHKAEQDSAQSLAQMGTLLPDSLATPIAEQTLTLGNDVLQLGIDTRGGRISSATLREYSTYYGDSLRIFRGQGNAFGLRFWSQQAAISTNNALFEPQLAQSQLKAEKPGDTARLAMRLWAGADAYIEYVYTLPYGEYAVGLTIALHNMRSHIAANQQYLDLEWAMRTPQQEKGAKKESEYTLLAYQAFNEDYEEIHQKDELVRETVSTGLKWVAFKEQFFSAILRAKQDEGDGEGSFRQAEFTLATSPEAGCLKDFSALLMLPYQGKAHETHALELYLGPNLYKTLRSYGQGYEAVVPLGGWLVGWINKYVVINVFDWLSRAVNSYGIIILLLTLLIKAALFPLTYKSYASQAKMRVLKPMVDELSQKYPRQEDALKKQQAIMGLYKRAGVSPLGGCLPMLIQFPILIAMFRFFPASFELRQEPFLWADDLSSYDSVLNLPFNIPFYGDHVSLFTLLMAAALLVTSLMSFKQSANMGGQMKSMQFMMLYLMPIMMLVWFNDYSAGLSYYYFLANLITIAQTLIIRRTIDEKALFLRLQSNAQKPAKKSRFLERLERMQKEQQQRANRR